MLIELFRHTFTEKSTIGTLRIGQRSWYCIEDKDRGLRQDMPIEQIRKEKIYAQTCIPYGMYKVLITQSARFSKLRGRPIFMPELINVPGFTGIRIHPANFATQLEGCIAPGMNATTDMVSESRKAYAQILELINASLKSGEDVWIDIKKQ